MAEFKKMIPAAPEVPETKPEAKPDDKGPKLVKMRRSHPQHPGGPLTATVHPSEVDDYAIGGWVQLYGDKE
jgi:hypothetical protein